MDKSWLNGVSQNFVANLAAAILVAAAGTLFPTPAKGLNNSCAAITSKIEREVRSGLAPVVELRPEVRQAPSKSNSSARPTQQTKRTAQLPKRNSAHERKRGPSHLRELDDSGVKHGSNETAPVKRRHPVKIG
jgi:hypothetical protein